MHYSVLKRELIESLNIKSTGIYVDATLGYAGDASEILKKIKRGYLFAFDQDPDAVEYSNKLLSSIGGNYKIFPCNFVNMKECLERENITREQLDVIIATVKGEAAADSYEDAYAVINTFYNRTISKTWINEMIRATGEDKGRNLYEQITLINQSEVYTSGRYKEFLGTNDGPVYQAVIDFLYTLDRKHDYLCFFASYGDIPDSVQFVPGGNWYYSLMPSEDKVQELTLVREKDWS